MSFKEELASFGTPAYQPTIADSIKVGDVAPQSDKLKSAQTQDGQRKPMMLTFLRHCGCPFAEKAFRTFRDLAAVSHLDIQFVAISHSSQADTDEWLIAVGGYGEVTVVYDPDRDIYAQWGLGMSSYWAVLSPKGLYDVWSLGSAEGIKNKPTKSGYRWQTAGSFAVDEEGIVKWAHVSQTASDMSDYKAALAALGVAK